LILKTEFISLPTSLALGFPARYVKRYGNADTSKVPKLKRPFDAIPTTLSHSGVPARTRPAAFSTVPTSPSEPLEQDRDSVGDHCQSPLQIIDVSLNDPDGRTFFAGHPVIVSNT
jgi:hypothetical protein